jgi:Domain of unknown function (DUF4349)
MRRDVSQFAAPLLAFGLLIGTAACSQAPRTNSAPAAGISALKAAPSPNGNSAQDGEQSSAPDNATKPAPPNTTKPQLIRTANLRLSVRSIDQTLSAIRQLVQQQQGDIYNFDDIRANDNDHRSASLEIKVPQDHLDPTIAALSKFGTVISTQVKSEDVTTQIVDTEARLKNLRQQETMTQKIMERAGSVKDVLAVSQELAQVRQQIEQLDAQVKQFKGQVAFSTVTLSLEEAVATGTNPGDNLGLQVQDTWNRSTRSASGLMRGLFLFGIGLIPFLPFLLLIGGGTYWVQRQLNRRRRAAATVTATVAEPTADSTHPPQS